MVGVPSCNLRVAVIDRGVGDGLDSVMPKRSRMSLMNLCWES